METNLQIRATLADATSGVRDVQLVGASGGSVAEVRFTNSMNGRETVELVNVGPDGSAVLTYPEFGNHTSVRARILDSKNDETLHSFVTTPTDDRDTITMVPASVYAAQSQGAPAMPTVTGTTALPSEEITPVRSSISSAQTDTSQTA